MSCTNVRSPLLSFSFHARSLSPVLASMFCVCPIPSYHPRQGMKQMKKRVIGCPSVWCFEQLTFLANKVVVMNCSSEYKERLTWTLRNSYRKVHNCQLSRLDSYLCPGRVPKTSFSSNCPGIALIVLKWSWNYGRCGRVWLPRLLLTMDNSLVQVNRASFTGKYLKHTVI